MERFATPDDLDHLLELSPPRHWVAAAGVVLVLAAALVWGTRGTLSTRVAARGVWPGGDAAALRVHTARAALVRPGMPVRVEYGTAGRAHGRVAGPTTCGGVAAGEVCVRLEGNVTGPAGVPITAWITVRRERPLRLLLPAEGGR